MKQQGIEEVVQQFFKLLPQDINRSRQDMEKNIRAALTATFSKMHLITREEFDIQSELLSNTRAAMDELENKITALEKKLSGELGDS